MEKRIQVELFRSPIGTPQWMRVIVRTLGLKKIRQVKDHPDNGAIRGMVKKVSHLVRIK